MEGIYIFKVKMNTFTVPSVKMCKENVSSVTRTSILSIFLFVIFNILNEKNK